MAAELHPDSSYLIKEVGVPLSSAIAAACKARPADAVEFVAVHLLKSLEVSAAAQKEKLIASAPKSSAQSESAPSPVPDVSAISAATSLEQLLHAAEAFAKSHLGAAAVYAARFEKAPPQAVKDEDGNVTMVEDQEPEEAAAEPAADAAPPPAEGEDGAPPAEAVDAPAEPKALPKVPKAFWLRYVIATDNNRWLLGKGLRRKIAPATFSALDGRACLIVNNVFNTDKTINFHGQPLLGSYACAALVDEENAVVGCLCLDTLGTHARISEQHEAVLNQLKDAFAPKFYSLFVAVELKKKWEREQISSLSPHLSATPEEAVAEEDDAAAIDAKVAAGTARLDALKAAVAQYAPAAVLDAELGDSSSGARSALAALVIMLRGSKDAPLHALADPAASLLEAAGSGESLLEAVAAFDPKPRRVLKSFAAAKQLTSDTAPDALVTHSFVGAVLLCFLKVSLPPSLPNVCVFAQVAYGVPHPPPAGGAAAERQVLPRKKEGGGQSRCSSRRRFRG
jgi:hypothetical protein